MCFVHRMDTEKKLIGGITENNRKKVTGRRTIYLSHSTCLPI